MTGDAPENNQAAPDPPPPPDANDPPAYEWPPGKADPTKRFVAILIDGVIAVVIGMVPWIGGLISTAYWVLRDGLELEFMDNRSVGKKVMKLRAVTADGQNPDLIMSVQRNWMFGLGGIIQILIFIPVVGWLLMVPLGLIAMGMGIVEILKVFNEEDGRRFGDVWADTKVIEVDD